MRATVLFTGGKDSHFSLYWAVLQGFEIPVLASLIPSYDYSMLYHRPVEDILKLQSRALNIPLEIEYVYDPEDELAALKRLLSRIIDDYHVEAVFSGAILSDFQRMRFSMIAEELGLLSYTPLWRIDQEKYMFELVDSGFEILITSISTLGLGPGFVGRVLSRDDVEAIIRRAKRYGFNPAFEGGEAETLVVYMPLYRYRLRVEGETLKRGPYNYEFVIRRAWIEDHHK